MNTESIDRLIVSYRGEIIFNHSTELGQEPIALMSVTKSIVAMLVCQLVDQGFIKSLDTKICEIYPEWNQGLKAHVTVRHFLSHTSGLRADRDTREIYSSDDYVKLALNSEIIAEPGTRCFYNNKAVNLFSGIIPVLTGLSMADFARKNLFRSLNITNFSWYADRAGHSSAMADLDLLGEDLLKLGLLMLQQGMWQGEQVISRGLCEAMTAPAQELDPTSSLLWWRSFDYKNFYYTEELLDQYLAEGISKSYVQPLRTLVGKKMPLNQIRSFLIDLYQDTSKVDQFFGACYARQLPHRLLEVSGENGFKATGYLEQELFVSSQHDLVAVRQVHWEKASKIPGFTLPDFSQAVLEMIK